MAMIICASFCLINGGARNGEIHRIKQLNPGVTSAEAVLYISEWPQDTGSTDLYALTLAFGDEYISDIYVSCTAYVDLIVTMEDFSSLSDCDRVTIYDDSSFAAGEFGDDLVGGEPYYAIIDFESYHFVEVEKWVIDEDAHLWHTDSRFDGSPELLSMYY